VSGDEADGKLSPAAAADRVPIGEVLSELQLRPLPEDWTPVEAFVLIKCVDSDGDAQWAYRTTSAPNREELLGALTVQVDVLRKELLDEWAEPL
jgi:hypothetical protein